MALGDGNSVSVHARDRWLRSRLRRGSVTNASSARSGAPRLGEILLPIFVLLLLAHFPFRSFLYSARGDRMKQAQTDADELIAAYRMEQQDAFDKAASASGKWRRAANIVGL